MAHIDTGTEVPQVVAKWQRVVDIDSAVVAAGIDIVARRKQVAAQHRPTVVAGCCSPGWQVASLQELEPVHMTLAAAVVVLAQDTTP